MNWHLQPGSLAIIVLTLCMACNTNQSRRENDRLLAQVHNKNLYLSELEGMVPEGSSHEDSALIINAFVERWVREAVLLNEAEQNVPKDLNIDKLVRDYRASLIKNNYEQILVTELLDSLVTQQEMTAFYENNKNQFQLDDPIFRIKFAKIPLDAPDLEYFEKLWRNMDKEGNAEAIAVYAKNYAVASVLNDSIWYSIPEIAMELPYRWISTTNVGQNTSFIKSDDTYRYFFLVKNYVAAQEIPPLSYVEEKAKRIILHQRKQKLLEKKKEEMYERALRRNNIKIIR